MDSVEHLDVLLRAACPVILVVSHEEDRVAAALQGLVDKQNKKFGSTKVMYTWSQTTGLVSNNEQVNDKAHPVEVLGFIASHKESAVFLLKDFLEFLTNSPGYIAQRKLRDVAASLQEGTTIVMLDVTADLPSRVEKITTVIDFDLPKAPEIAQMAIDLMSDLPATRRMPKAEQDTLAMRAADSAIGLTKVEIENVFARSLAEKATLSTKVIVDEKKTIIRKSGVLQFYDVDRGMDSVGGLSVLKKWLKVRGSAFTKKARDFGLPHPKGMLILGIPGTGKSLVAKSIGSEWEMPILRMDVGALFGSLVGQSEANMRKAIQTAEAMAPCVLWIDELEKSLGGGGGGNDGGTTSRVFGSFLSWMQEKKSPVFVVATANDVSKLPPEMLRRGRFDELFFVDLPDAKDRRKILEIHLGLRNRLTDGIITKELLEATEGYSGAELEQVVIDAMFDAFAGDGDVTTQLLVASADKTTPISDTMAEQIDALRNWADGRAMSASGRPKKPSNSTSRKRRQIQS